MSKVLYTLEDYFDALSEQRHGVTGWVSRRIGAVFAVVGDAMRVSAFRLGRLQ